METGKGQTTALTRMERFECSGQTVLMCDATDPTRPRRVGDPLTGRTSSVHAVAFAPDGRTLAAVGADQAVILWDLTDLQTLRDHAWERACSLASASCSITSLRASSSACRRAASERCC